MAKKEEQKLKKREQKMKDEIISYMSSAGMFEVDKVDSVSLSS